jgi:hypothetical protein
VRIVVKPVMPRSEPPPETVTDPPVPAASELPACISKWPPVDDDDVPTETLMEPEGPLTAFPVKIETLPLGPDVVLPVDTDRYPDTPSSVLRPLPIKICPVPTVDDPENNDNAPLDAPPDTPVMTVSAPESPLAVVPVDINMCPLVLNSAALAVLIVIPPDDDDPAPVMMVTDPPERAADVEPARSMTEPPVPEFELPTTKLTGPAAPPVVKPEANSKLPELPTVVLPVDSVMAPLVPVAVVPVCNVIRPLPRLVDCPVNTLIAPVEAADDTPLPTTSIPVESLPPVCVPLLRTMLPVPRPPDAFALRMKTWPLLDTPPPL